MGKHSTREKQRKGAASAIWRGVKGLLLGLFVLCCGIGIYLFSYLMGLSEWREFDPYQIGEMQHTLLIYDRNGAETAALYNMQNRVHIDIEDIPEHVKNAFIAVEDARFYQHRGVDFIRIAGAFIEDVKNGNRNQGASTISQQLVKNTNLTGEKTIARKLQEAVMALKLEQIYEKDEILEMYLNYIPFGNGAYGIEAATKVYFNTTTQSLTIAQAAQLAGVIKAPTYYAPHLDMERSVGRRNLVLGLMEQQGYITPGQAAAGKNEPVVLSDKTKFEYGYFADMVLAEAERILGVSSEALLSGGYRIHTTLDQSVQNHLEALFEDADNFPEDAEDGTMCQAAVCVLDSQTSEIRAVMGGREYETRRGINRAADIKRQPGSAIKPVIVYAPAMERLGYMPATLVLDERGDFDGYVPKNFSDRYDGWVTLREALSRSLNLPAVRVLQKLGVSEGKLYASSVGIPFDDGDNGLTLALGGFTTGVSPLRLCNAFTPFANGGYFSQPGCITKIENSAGRLIYQQPELKAGVLSAETAYMMTSMLQSAAQSGTARRVFIDDVPLAAKTGTSGPLSLNGNQDAWTVVYNPEYTVCCWMGFDITDSSHCLAGDVTGGTYPAKLIRELFMDVYENDKAPQFKMPGGVVQAKIDLYTVMEGGAPMLAGTFTPEEHTVNELFFKEEAPSEYSSYWAVPQLPKGFSVTHGSGGYPQIRFGTAQPHVIYRVMRMDIRARKTVQIGEFSGETKWVDFIDHGVEYGNSYRYYVVPVHPEIVINNQPLAGPQTAAVKITLLSEDNYMP